MKWDNANHLTSVVQGADSYTFAYNGLGDRLSQTVDGNTTNYTLDIVSGLTQVLSDGTSTYLYGAGRIGEQGAGGWQYPLGDALGSVRQLTDPSSEAMLAKDFAPFGDVLSTTGDSSTNYGFTGEWTATGWYTCGRGTMIRSPDASFLVILLELLEIDIPMVPTTQ